MDLEKIFVIPKTEQEWLSGIYKETQLNHKQPKQSHEKWARDMNRQFTELDVEMTSKSEISLIS